MVDCYRCRQSTVTAIVMVDRHMYRLSTVMVDSYRGYRLCRHDMAYEQACLCSASIESAMLCSDVGLFHVTCVTIITTN